MDVLTNLLHGIQSKNQIYGRFELSAPWGMHLDNERRSTMYAVSRGNAVLTTRGAGPGTTLQLTAGDIVLVRQGLTHTIKDHPRSRAASAIEVYAQRGGRCGGNIQYGGGGAPTTIISAGFSFASTKLDPLIAFLPPLLHVRGDSGEAARWLESTLQFMASEMHAQTPGYELVASRLADVLFVHALRSHVHDRPCESASWLRAIGDPQLGIAFQRMHERPADPWTVETLAKAASMSRSGFAARFTEELGVAPLTYLTRWRIHRAAEMLAEGPTTIAQIASAVGYETEGAFTKVFKRHLGETPGAYRRRVRSAEAAA